MQSRLLTIREQWLLLGVGTAIILGASVLMWRGSIGARPPADTFPAEPTEREAPFRVPDPPLTAPPPATIQEPPAPRIGVGVMGAVAKPGLYYFETGARVQDLLDAAGDVLPGSDLSDINRTAFLIDETTLLVPRLVSDGRLTYPDPADPHNPRPYTRSAWYQLNEVAAAPTSPPNVKSYRAAASAVPGRTNINTASQQELEALPGIGPVTARKIIAYRQQRPFQRPEDLENVSGIGPAKMAALRNKITVN